MILFKIKICSEKSFFFNHFTFYLVIYLSIKYCKELLFNAKEVKKQQLELENKKSFD